VTLIFAAKLLLALNWLTDHLLGYGKIAVVASPGKHVANRTCGRNRVSVKGHQLRLGVFAAVLALVCVNALTPWGDAAARVGATVLQATACAAAVICGVVVSRRVHGLSRWWRLLVVAGCLSWLVGELLSWAAGGESGSGAAPPAAVAAYFLPPLLGLAAMVVLVRAGGGVAGHPDGQVRSSLVITVLDGIVSAVAFSILVYISGFRDMSSRVLPRSDNTDVLVAYSVIELVVVVAGVLMAVIYRPDRPYRANYLLLSGSIVVIAASDRLVAYFRSVGVEGGELWGGIAFVLGPLMLAFAVLELPRRRPARDEAAMDWAQLILPYSGFLGVAVLFAFHLSIGRQLSAILNAATVLMVLLVASRQVVAVRAQRLLTHQLYEVQSRLAHQVHHDPLTGLPNRVLFAQRLEDAMRDGQFVLIYVDIDDFKEVNDRFGHAGGDELLCAMGGRLKRCLRKGDMLARIGGDEFAILIEGDSEAPQIVADRIRVALRDPFAVHGSSVQVRASMGLVRPGADGHAPTSDDLLRQADISMYAGKRLGKDTAVIHRPSSGLAADFPTVLRQAKGAVPPGFSLAYQLCDAQGLDVIAEGIESSAQAERIFVAGCRLAQGHFLGRPAPITDICLSSSHERPLRRA
jgi:diguanylate cyclase